MARGPQRPDWSQRTLSRRALLRGAALGSAGLAAAACGFGDDEPAAPHVGAPLAAGEPREIGAPAEGAAPALTPEPTAEPTPRPPDPAGRIERTLMTGSAWENPALIMHSGVAGERVLVLGGVHGNEPGGWTAAEEIASWAPNAGSLIVVPRANILSTHALVRTFEEIGDLNRLYPGSFTAELPMARMAANIVSLAREFEVTLVIDMHESWGFYAERTESQNGTAFIGQTVTGGPGADASVAEALGEAVNAQIEVERDRLVLRDRRRFQPPGSYEFMAGLTPDFGWRPGRGRSSLSLGNYVEGLTPILVEMGQQDQPVERRVELHQLVVRTALQQRGML